MRRMEIGFSGNSKVHAKVGDFVVMTDQPVKYGGENSAPAPYDLFLASLGTCAGYYVASFCQQRGISTDNIKIFQDAERGSQKGVLGKVTLEIQVPSNFPEQYRDALVHAVNICSVKKTIQNPPEFEVNVETI